MPRFRKIAGYSSAQALTEQAAALGIDLPAGDASSTLLAGSWSFNDRSAGRLDVANRFTILPMEGWDATPTGAPGDLVERRWLRFAESGAGLLWFEATAVRHDGRANGRQLVLNDQHVAAFRTLRETVLDRHKRRYGDTQPVLTGLQLTHSGRWCRPDGRPAPRIVYHHPLLDCRVDVTDADDSVLLSDSDIDRLIEDFIAAAVRVRDAGFDFVDIKHCHGYFAHELLSAYQRPGRYGGSLENRTRFLREVVAALRERCPELAIAVRFSAFDFQPFQPGPDRIGEPQTAAGVQYPYAFGSRTGLDIDWQEIMEFVAVIEALGIGLICVSAGSPYYTPHIQRPAFYPPSDGYQPPEDPLLGVARLLDATRRIKQNFPGLAVIGTGFTYLQQYLPAIAAGCIEQGWMDSIGLGRVSLSYPDLPDAVLQQRIPERKLLCRTFSDCTTAPRNGMVSGCYPLDDHYRHSPEYERLQKIKRTL